LHTDRLCDRFSSDYTTRAALKSTYKMPFSSLKNCSVSDNTFCNYNQVGKYQGGTCASK